MKNLLRHTIYGTPIEVSRYENLSESDWEALYMRSVREGLQAVIFDAVSDLPSDIKLPRTLRLKWAAGTDAIEKQYFHKQKIADEITGNFTANGINSLIIKGLTIAEYYKIPSHREFGDIDIFTDNHKSSNRLLLDLGAKRGHNDYKHTGFSYKGVMIENHAHFISGNALKKYKILDDYLIKTAFDENKRNNLILTHFMAHALHHFPDSWRWRYFYDWAVLLHAMRKKWDFEEFEKLFTDSGCKRIVDAFVAIAAEYFDIPDDETPPCRKDTALIETIHKEMEKPMKSGYYNILVRRVKLDGLSNPAIKFKTLQAVKSVLEVLFHTAKSKLRLYFRLNF